MSEQKKKDTLKNIMINLGVMMVLVGSTAVKADNLMFFFMGLIILAIQVFDFKSVDAKRLVMAEIIISGTLTTAAITQLAMSKKFGAPQVFLVVLLLGSILIVIESLRKFVDLE